MGLPLACGATLEHLNALHTKHPQNRTVKTVVTQDPRLRRLVFGAAYAFLIAASLSAAMAIAAPATGLGLTARQVVLLLTLAVAIKSPLLYWQHMFDLHWSNVDVRDMLGLTRAMAVGSLLFSTAIILVHDLASGPEVPYRVMILDLLFSVFAVGGFMVSRRVNREWWRSSRQGQTKKILIIGAGRAGQQLARSLREEAIVSYEPIGFIDDDQSKKGVIIHGVRVMGTRHDIPKVVRDLKPDELWVVIPSAPGSVIREMVDLAQKGGVSQVKVVPGLMALLTGRVKTADLQDASSAALLGRDVVTVNTDQVRGYLEGRRVLVTGAAGSIGSELCEQIARFAPSHLIMLDQDESGLYNIEHRLRSVFPSLNVTATVGDICHPAKVDRVFMEFLPEILFHAAAYKHVPMMEQHPDEAISTNIFGTNNLAQASVRHGVQKFVLISTDKAVNPSSVMGATKRAAEILLYEMNRLNKTQFMAVRFGNVLGSRGSVVPLFREQIARGGPVTVTHPEMKRYFMITSEAVQLVLQAGALGNGGEVFVLDMGEPVKIVDLARQLIRLSGLEPDKDIAIVFIGNRPGEKLFEDILTAEEGTSATGHGRIFIAKISHSLTNAEYQDALTALQTGVDNGRNAEMLISLRRLVPTFKPEVNVLAAPVGRPALQQTDAIAEGMA